MKKRVISIFLCLALVAALLPCTALFAGAAEPRSWGDGVFWTLEAGVLTISGNGTMDGSMGINNIPWYNARNAVKTVVIESGVKNICNFAFYECKNMTEITIPDTVTEIGVYAFCNCTALTEIAVPDTVTVISGYAFFNAGILENEAYWEDGGLYFGKVLYQADSASTGDYAIREGTCFVSPYAFSECENLNTVILPASLTELSGSMLAKSGIRTMALPETVTSIPAGMFYSCKNLTSVTIPTGVTSIGNSAFEECTSLTALTVPDSVTSIEEEAFLGCTKLNDLRLPDTLTNIGRNILQDTPYYTNAANWMSGVFYYGGYLLGTKSDSVSGACVIKDGTVGTADFAFLGCTGLTYAVIPDSVKFLGKSAFESCQRLSYVSLGSGLTELADDAFGTCESLTEIVIPANITKIGIRTFCNCTCLKTVTLTDSVTEIGNMAFLWCPNLSEVFFYGTQAQWEQITFGDSNEDLFDCEFHFVNYGDCGNGVYWTLDALLGVLTVFGDGEMDDFDAEHPAPWSEAEIVSVYIENDVTDIGDNAFAGCDAIEKVYFYGTQSEWDAIAVGSGNENLTSAPLMFLTDTGDPCDGYIDINRSSWYHEAADFVIMSGLMGSTSTYEMKFEPNTKVSRAMVTAIIYNLFGSPRENTYNYWFSDVHSTDWFNNAVSWCAYYGLAAGKGDGLFDPNGAVTRQELAVFMMSTARAIGADVGKKANLSRFADASKVPAWSKDAVAWAVDAGLISGKAQNGKLYLAPTDTATRAELAVIVMRFVQKYADAE